ncbi:unnamed protein product [Merluccius merluccius]
MAMSRSYLAKKLFEIEELQSLGEDLPAEMSNRPDSASAPRHHARRVTSAERLPPLTGAESSPLLAAATADRSLLIAAIKNASLAAAVERKSLNATERAPPTTSPPAAAAGIPMASLAPRTTFKLPRYALQVLLDLTPTEGLDYATLGLHWNDALANGRRITSVSAALSVYDNSDLRGGYDLPAPIVRC